MRTTPTLRGRVSLLGLAVIGGWLFVLAAGFDIVLSVRLDRQVDDALVIRAQAASATVATASGTITGVRESATDAALDNSIWVYRGTTALDITALERPRAPADLQRAADSLATTDIDFADRAGHRLHVLPLRTDGRRVGAVVAAVDLDPYDRTRNTAILGSIVVAVLLLGGVYPALRYVAGRALRPVETMAAEATEYSGTLPIRRFGEGQRYAELQQLAGNLDELLGRLATSLRHERHLSDDLSHELRTPLTRITMQVDLLTPAAPADIAAELAAIRQNCEAMNRIVDSLLTAARTELSATSGRADLATVFAQMCANGDPLVRIAETTLVVGVDADVAERTLAPIVENARRYARHRVDISAVRNGAQIEIRIGNDGPAIAPDDRLRIFEPGVRDDATTHQGAGLGLALARRLARAADGDVTVDADAVHATFVVTLPAG